MKNESNTLKGNQSIEFYFPFVCFLEGTVKSNLSFFIYLSWLWKHQLSETCQVTQETGQP